MEYLRRNKLVCDGLQHSHGEGDERGEEEGDDDSPGWYLGGENGDRDNKEDKAYAEYDAIPRPRDLMILQHQTGMNVTLIFQGTPESSDDISTEPH